MDVLIKKVGNHNFMPEQATDGSACIDLKAVDIQTGFDDYGYPTLDIDFGIALQIPKGYMAQIYPRSSISKTSFFLTNGVGIIDSDYRGVISGKFKSNSKFGLFGNVTDADKEYFQIGNRVAQLAIIKHEPFDLIEVAKLSKTKRGEGGYGSTGLK